MQYFTMGTWVLGLALGVAWAGTLVGLICIRQSTLSVTAKFRLVWLTAAAVCIGTIGTQVSATVTVLGLGLSTGEIHYNLYVRAAAMLMAAVGILAGLLIAGRNPKPVRLGIGALVIGLCLGLMTYLGLYSVVVQGTTEISPATMAGCTVLLVVISAGLLWATRLRSTAVLVGVAVVYAGLAMGIHYLGLSGLSIRLDPAMSQPDGQDLFMTFIPAFVVAIMSLGVPITAVLVAPDRTGRLQPESRSKRNAANNRKRRGPGSGRKPADRRTQAGRRTQPDRTTEPVG